MPCRTLPARLGVVCVLLGDREQATRVNAIISEFGRLIMGFGE